MLPPLILFGAFDRHNLGDLLLGRIATAMAARLAPGRPLAWAGLAGRDLRAVGGAQVETLETIAGRCMQQAPGLAPPDLLQVGGEILGCSAWEAAVMLAEPGQVVALIAAHDSDLAGRDAWARGRLGIARTLPYLSPRHLFPPGARVAHAGTGGVAFEHLPAAARAEALDALRTAAALHVRDRRTQVALAAAGIDAALAPDPAALVERLFGDEIARHTAQGEPAAIRARFPQGWIATQLSAEFGDDASLDTLAADLDRLHQDTGFGLVLFCAGRAPWHDDPAVLHRLRTRLKHHAECIVADSEHLFALCALIAGAHLCLASSLHVRIVAEAFARPAISLVQASAQGEKLRAYLDTWHGDAPLVHELGTGPSIRLTRSALVRSAVKCASHNRELASLAETALQRCFAALHRS